MQSSNLQKSSWATCYTGSNNTRFDFPPIMADGRNFSNWQPEAAINENIRRENNIKTNWEYRQYLATHAKEVIAFNQSQASNQQQQQHPQQHPQHPQHQHQQSDLKQQYLQTEHQQINIVAPTIQIRQL